METAGTIAGCVSRSVRIPRYRRGTTSRLQQKERLPRVRRPIGFCARLRARSEVGFAGGLKPHPSAVQNFAYPRCRVFERVGPGEAGPLWRRVKRMAEVIGRMVLAGAPFDAAGQGEVLQYLDKHAET